MRTNKRIRTKEKKPTPVIVWWVLIITLFFVTYEVIIRYAEPRLLPIQNVKLNAQIHLVSRHQLHHQIRHHIKGFFSTDAMKLRQELLNLPYVEEVLIKRVWPDTLVIKVMEPQLVARWGDIASISSKGKLVNVKLSTDQKLPTFIGPDDQCALMLDEYNELSQILKPLNVTIQELVLNSRRSWQLTLNNGIKITIGRKESKEKLKEFVAVYPKLQYRHGSAMDSIDLRYPNGISVHTK